MDKEKLGTKVLNNFEPFNDVWYKDCFYHALFPIVTHFDRDIFTFLINDTFVYTYNEDKTGIKLSLDVISKKNEIEVLIDLGIDANVKIASSNIISDLISSINNERPAIIFIDCYYESIRPDTFQKDHFPHTLLIYGYDNIEETFYIIEHRYKDSYLFEKRTISYSDIVNSYNGFIDNLQEDKKEPTYFEFTIESDDKCTKMNKLLKKDIYVDIFLEYLQENRIAIYKGIEDLKRFANDYKQIVFEETSLKSNIDDLLNVLHQIINNKNLERYCMLKIYNSNIKTISLCESVINNWNFIKGIIAKYRYSSQYNLKSFEKSIEKLKEIYDFECRWYDSLFNSYDQMRDCNE